MKKTVLAMCITLSFSGCAHLEAMKEKNAATSYVSKEISDYDAETVGEDMAKFLAGEFPAAKTTIYIEPSKTTLREVLVDELSDKGFGILEIRPDKGSAVVLQYYVTELGKGILLRMRYQGKIASRYYGRMQDGDLSLSNKIAVREAAK
jgi:hypothetical protein